MKDLDFIKKAITFLVLTVGFCSLNAVVSNVPLSVGLYAGFLFSGGPIIVSGIALAASFLLFDGVFLKCLGLCIAVIFSFIAFVYRKNKKTPGVESIIYVFMALGVYILSDFGDEKLKKLAYVAIIAIFSLVAREGLSFIFHKKTRPLNDKYERLALFATEQIVMIGAIRLFGIQVYLPIALFAFCIGLRYYGSEPRAILPIALGLPAFFALGEASFLLYFLLLYAIGVLFCGAQRIFTVIFVALGALLGKYLDLLAGVPETVLLPSVILIFTSALFPESLLSALREKLDFNPEEVLSNALIHEQRMETSSRLYDISNTFYHIRDGLIGLKKTSKDPQVVIDKIVDEVIFNMCQSCSFRERCTFKNFPKNTIVEKIVRVGITKGRITLIDVPKEFTDVCGFPNSVVFEVNRLIGQYCEYIQSAESSDKTKEILALQSMAVGGAIKKLAFSLSEKKAENTSLKKKIYKALCKRGISPEGMTVFGDGDGIEIFIVIKTSLYDGGDLAAAVSAVTPFPMCVKSVTPIRDDMTTVRLTKKPDLDAAFGVSKITKTHSPASGDCHSLIKIDESSFLVALSDGMGSGEVAENTSKTALDLIEALYKGGLDTQFILDFSNRLLTMMVDDSFAAIDIATVDLADGSAAFVKIGSPYGFILSESGIRFVEGASLPLGILDELKPTTATADLNKGDVILLVSDGVTDAFGSSSEFLDFLKSAPLSNPQNLADMVVGAALKRSNGIAEDDMTAIAVRML